MLFIIAVKPREVKSVMQNLKKVKAYKVAANLFVKWPGNGYFLATPPEVLSEFAEFPN